MGPYDFNEWMDFLGLQNVSKQLKHRWEEDGGFTTDYVTKSRNRLLFNAQKYIPLVISVLICLWRE